MTSPQTEPAPLSKRPKRADALRNYEKLVAAAREAFTEADRSASLEDIARRAGVGIGTLYRNFPTRADLVQAVYVDEVEALSRSAEELTELEPWEALTAWLQRFVGYVATKQALADELFAVADAERQAVFASCRSMPTCSVRTSGAEYARTRTRDSLSGVASRNSGSNFGSTPTIKK